MTFEDELEEMRSLVAAIAEKIDLLLEEQETRGLMVLEENSLKDFLLKEPDIYSFKDIKQGNGN